MHSTAKHTSPVSALDSHPYRLFELALQRRNRHSCICSCASAGRDVSIHASYQQELTQIVKPKLAIENSKKIFFRPKGATLKLPSRSRVDISHSLHNPSLPSHLHILAIGVLFLLILVGTSVSAWELCQRCPGILWLHTLKVLRGE